MYLIEACVVSELLSCCLWVAMKAKSGDRSFGNEMKVRAGLKENGFRWISCRNEKNTPKQKSKRTDKGNSEGEDAERRKQKEIVVLEYPEKNCLASSDF